MPKRPENAVADHRATIEQLKEQRAAICSRPASASEVEQRIDAFLEYQAERYRARIAVERLRQRASLDALGDKDDAFYAFFFGSQIKAALMAEASEGIPATDRAAEIDRIGAALLEAEKAEEQAITEAEKNGHRITRRADADPRAVLAFD